MSCRPVTLENLNWILHHPFSNIDNMKIEDERLLIEELKEFKAAGGSSVVDHTVRGLNPDPEGLIRIAQATGLKIITATGYYIAATHPENFKQKKIEEISEQLVRDIQTGIGDSCVCAGFLKGACGGPSSDSVEETEKKVLFACALAQKHTGATIAIHNMRGDFVPEVLDILRDAGADLTRTIMMHADRWGSDPAIFPKLLQSGCYLEFDGFGTAELALVPPRGFNYQINDAQRCDMIKRLELQGYLKQILISQDVWVKTRHSSFGGAGYEHILRHTIPLMQHKGISDTAIHTLMVENPARIFSFVPVIDE
jgi:phosphotriesterase-related protein